ncbi:hypothetical protein CEXT_776131 [Caerostris extrusa]|uniref:Uncharacterized protein n=1 Tax=Caerostris extrusa TaxID=172846 RepID=A0AAV4QIW8_CAEEX|nr:hypothetical protein CEXT_776131 [Caerostris extrusa]
MELVSILISLGVTFFLPQTPSSTLYLIPLFEFLSQYSFPITLAGSPGSNRNPSQSLLGKECPRAFPLSDYHGHVGKDWNVSMYPLAIVSVICKECWRCCRKFLRSALLESSIVENYFEKFSRPPSLFT